MSCKKHGIPGIRCGWCEDQAELLEKRAQVERPHTYAVEQVAAERERCAKVCRERAMKMEAEAQRAGDAGEHDEVSALRATAWQLVVAEREILGA